MQEQGARSRAAARLAATPGHAALIGAVLASVAMSATLFAAAPGTASRAAATPSTSPSGAATDPGPPGSVTRSESPPVRGSLAQLQDGWLSADAVVVGTYAGIDSALGARYHVAQVEDVWTGNAGRGRLVFKAPRGVRAGPGDHVVLMLWERLNGAPDSYLDESGVRFGEQVWTNIGPDSLAAYLLPFPSYAYPLDKDKLVLQGASAFPTEIELSDLHRQLLDFEYTLLPRNLVKDADTVLRARVQRVDKLTEKRLDIVVGWWIQARLLPQETWKGRAPDTLQLRFVSFPRSPRFKEGEEVILFLSRAADGTLFLAQGKRAVFHVSHGEVEETRQPVAEFKKSLRTP